MYCNWLLHVRLVNKNAFYDHRGKGKEKEKRKTKTKTKEKRKYKIQTFAIILFQLCKVVFLPFENKNHNWFLNIESVAVYSTGRTSKVLLSQKG